MVSKCSVAADIGTDHGYVAEMLLKDNTCEHVIATDINKGPLNRAIEHLTNVNLNERCTFRLGGGLAVLKENEADTIIIAGMGGELIIDIIEETKNIALAASQLILQPMTKIGQLRQYLYENNFKIIDENIVKEFYHYYFIIKAIPGMDNIEDEIYFEISKIVLEKRDPLMIEYIEKQISINENIITSIEKNTNCDYNVKIEAMRKKNEKIRELMEN